MEIVFYNTKRHLTPQELCCVSPARRARALKYHFPQDRARCLAAGWLLAHHMRVAEESFFFGENGKPYAPAGHPYFNISHAGRYVVLAMAPRELGVDIEPIGPYDNAVAKQCFTPRELEWMERQAGEEAFYRLWTAKESVMKAVGKGFYLPPETFELLPEKGPLYLVEGRRWHLTHLPVKGHMVCAALQDKGEAIKTLYIE